MFAIRERVSPCSARCSPRSVGRLTSSAPSVCSTWMSRWIRSESSPRGPFTVTRSGSIETVTPEGTGMGCLPIRDIRLPHPRHDLAADSLDPRVMTGHKASGGGDDRRSHPALDPRDVGMVDVRALTWPRDALKPGDNGLALGRVLERHRDLIAGASLSRRTHGEVLDVALLLQDARDLTLDPGGRDLDIVLLGLGGVA